MTILITDDDHGHAQLMYRNLFRAGIRNNFKEFENGQEIIDFIFDNEERRKVDPEDTFILLLDINMPKVNGIEVLRQIKSDKNIKEIPVFIVSTTENQKEVDLCYELGCAKFLKKPVVYTDFVQMITEFAEELKHVNAPKLS